MKRLFIGPALAVVAALILLAAVFAPYAAAASRPFSDVKPGAWYESDLAWAIDSRIVSGYSNGTFRPLAATTEAEFLVMLLRATEPESVRTPRKGEAWHVPYYEKAADFRLPLSPADHGKAITRGLSARLIAASLGRQLDTVSAVKFMLATKLSSGKTASTVEGYQASARLNRAEAVAFIHRLHKYREQLSSEDPGEETPEGNTPGGGSTPPGTTPPPGNGTRPQDPVRPEDNLKERTEKLQSTLQGLGLTRTETTQGIAVNHPERDGSGAILDQSGGNGGNVLIMDDGNATVLASAHALLQFAGIAIDDQSFRDKVEQVKTKGTNVAVKIGKQMVTFVRNTNPGQMSVSYTVFGS